MRMGMITLGLFLAFQWGRSAEKADHEEEQRELAQRYAKDLTGANASAYERGREAALEEAKNNVELDQIVRDAEGLQGCDGVFIPADIVERLRQLQ